MPEYGNRILEDGALELRLPYPPTANNLKVPVRNRPGVYYLTPKAQRFRADVTWICAGAKRFGRENVEVDIVLHPPDARMRDGDNPIKALFDALEAGAIVHNDVQIMKHTVTKSTVERDGGLVILVVRPWRGE
jgi:crossover junction endodeoxyribonuclease RusA